MADRGRHSRHTCLPLRIGGEKAGVVVDAAPAGTGRPGRFATGHGGSAVLAFSQLVAVGGDVGQEPVRIHRSRCGGRDDGALLVDRRGIVRNVRIDHADGVGFGPRGAGHPVNGQAQILAGRHVAG